MHQHLPKGTVLKLQCDRYNTVTSFREGGGERRGGERRRGERRGGKRREGKGRGGVRAI